MRTPPIPRPRRTRLRHWGLALLWCPALTGCVASTDITAVEEIAGTWLASNAIYSDITDPTKRFDLIALGFEVAMEIQPEGDWALILVLGDLVDLQQGTMAIDGKLLVLTDETGTYMGRAYLEGEQVSLQFRGGVEWDFDNDGTAERGKLNLIMDRQP
jgi:hypothetical protein